MPFKRVTNAIRDAKLPYYIKSEGDEDYMSTCFDDKIDVEARRINAIIEYIPESPKGTILDTSPGFKKTMSNNFLKTPGTISFTHFDKKNAINQRRKLVKRYLTQDQAAKSPKIRSRSLERVMPVELCRFYEFRRTLKETKRNCNTNLWFVLENVKDIFKAQKSYPMQNLLQDLGCLIFDFIFSSVQNLRFDQCRNILESLDEIESTVSEKSKLQPKSKVSVPLSPIASKQTTPVAINPRSFLNTLKIGKDLGMRKPPNQSLKSIMPGIFGSLTNKASGKVTSEPNEIRKPPVVPAVSENVLYKRFMKAIIRAKYIMAQIAHFLHYEQQSNSLSDLITCKDARKKSLTALISISSIDRNRDRLNNDSYIHSNCSTNLPMNSVPSIDLEEDKLHSARTDTSIFQQISYSTRLTSYFFETQSLMDDFDDKLVLKRKAKLQKYCVWKAKKWVTMKKKKELEKKYENYEIVCKICEKKVQIEKMKEHSSLCRLKAETNKDIKDFDKKISDSIFDAFMRSKELDTRLRVDYKNYNKLKMRCEKSRAGTPKGDSSIKSINMNLIKEASMKSSFTNSPDTTSATNQEGISFVRSKPIRRHTAYLKESVNEAPLIIRSQTGNSEKLRQTIEQLNKGFGDSQMAKSEDYKYSNSNEVDTSDIQNELDDKENTKKTFVARFLRTQRLLNEDFSSVDSDDISRQDSLNKSELIQRSTSFEKSIDQGDVNVHYYSDPQKSDVESEPSSDSKPTEGSISILPAHNLNRFLENSGNSGNSENVFLNNELSMSDKSAKSSPLVYRTMTSSYKKSKFYNENHHVFKFGSNKDKTEGDAEGNNEEKKTEKNAEVPRIFVRQGLVPLDLYRFTNEKTSDQAANGALNPVRQHNMVLQKELKKEDASANKFINMKLTEDIMKLKSEIAKKKEMIKVYEIITKKGKIIMNKEPYQWKMEILRGEVNNDINSLLSKVDDEDIKTFSNNFMNLIDKRIKGGKVFVETKKLLDQLDGNTPESQGGKLNLDRLSLLRGNTSQVFSRDQTFKKPLRNNPIQIKISAAAMKNLKGLVEEDIPSSQSSEKLNSLFPSRNQPTFGDPNEKNLSDSSYLDEIEQAFDNINDKSRGSGVMSEKSYGKPFENFVESKSIKDDFTPYSPYSELSIGQNNFFEQTSYRTGEDEDRRISISFTQQGDKKQPSEVGVERDDLENKQQNLEANKHVAEFPKFDSGSNSNFQVMTIDSPFKLNLSHKDSQESQQAFLQNFQQNMFQVSREPGSPETPSFEIKDPPPLIWRTSTAPTKSAKEVKKEKSMKQVLLNFRGDSQKETKDSFGSFSKAADEVYKENEEPVTDENVKPEESFERSSARTHTAVVAPRHQKQRDLVKMSNFKSKLGQLDSRDPSKPLKSGIFLSPYKGKIDQDYDDERDLKRFSSFRKDPKIFAEDIEEQKKENVIEECDSPMLMESPLLHRGYYSDTQAKNAIVSIKKNHQVGMGDFEPITLISKGAFGRVWLVRRKTTSDLYAMKVINLAERSAKNTQEFENLSKENKIFGLVQEDFVVRAVFTFIHETCICFVMEYMIGGDFGDILYNYCALDESVARFYIAEIVLALEYLHSIGIAHRDLKPDNILLDKNGHAKLTDFGLSESGLSKKIKSGLLFNEPESPMIFQKKAKDINKLFSTKNELDTKISLVVNGKSMEKKTELKPKFNDIRTAEKDEKEHIFKNNDKGSGDADLAIKKKPSKKPHRLIGTPDYMAPEIILGESINNFSIDWWSLGAMLFEFLCGAPPFNDDSPEKIFQNIVKLKIPWDQIKIGYDEDCMSPEAADLISKLLVLDHTQRLGAAGADDIKNHPFFNGLNWETLRKQKAPIIPEQKSETDTTNFSRMNDKLDEKEKQSPFEFFAPEQKATSNAKVAKELLAAASDKFTMSNYAALESGNMKLVGEALKEKEREFQQLKDEEPDIKEKKKNFDDIYDTPK